MIAAGGQNKSWKYSIKKLSSKTCPYLTEQFFPNKPKYINFIQWKSNTLQLKVKATPKRPELMPIALSAPVILYYWFWASIYMLRLQSICLHSQPFSISNSSIKSRITDEPDPSSISMSPSFPQKYRRRTIILYGRQKSL